MKYLIVALFALFTPILARPQAPPQPAQSAQPHPQAAPAAQGGPSTPVTIVSQTEVVGADGSFNFSYDTSNGIHVEQGGYVKKAAEAKSLDPNNPDATGDIQVIQGAYSYTAPDGQQISLRYVADDNGFQPEGEHLPKVPEGIARSLEQQSQQPGQQPQQRQQQVAQPQPQQRQQPVAQPQPQQQQPGAVSPSPSQTTQA